MVRKYILSTLVLTLLVSCSSSTPTPIPPEDIILRSVRRMTETSGFSFSIDRSGASAFLDPLNTLSLSRIAGEFVAPDQVQALVRVVIPGIVTDIGFIGIGENQWQTNPFSGNWEPLPPGLGFNPALLFDPSIGLTSILETDLSDLFLLPNDELETLPGKSLYHLSGSLLGEKAFAISFGLIGPDSMQIELWIAPDTFELHRMILVETSENADEVSTWQLDFWDFDLELEIEAPPLESSP